MKEITWHEITLERARDLLTSLGFKESLNFHGKNAVKDDACDLKI